MSDIVGSIERSERNTMTTIMTMRAVVWMVGVLASFCLMAVGVRELSDQVGTYQLLCYRSLIGLVVIVLIIAGTKNLSLFCSQRTILHGVRNFFHFGGQYGWFVGISLLPLAEVFALEFTVPLWTALIASIFLKEALTLSKLISIMLGILGVIVIVKPGIEVIDSAALVVLGAAICYAFSHTATKSLSSTENPLTVLFFMCLVQLPIALSFALADWQDPTGVQWLWVLAIGLTGLSAHYCMTKAMQYVEVTTVVIMDFFRLPVIAIVGVLLYSERFEVTLILGALLMLFGNLLNLYGPKKLMKIAKINQS